MALRKNPTLVLVMVLLSSCQSFKENNDILPEEKVNQLSSLIGASKFVREKCFRTDLPGDNQLVERALKEASKKNWDIRKKDQTQLLDSANIVFIELSADTTPLTEKCSEFNHSLAPFLSHALAETR